MSFCINDVSFSGLKTTVQPVINDNSTRLKNTVPDTVFNDFKSQIVINSITLWFLTLLFIKKIQKLDLKSKLINGHKRSFSQFLPSSINIKTKVKKTCSWYLMLANNTILTIQKIQLCLYTNFQKYNGKYFLGKLRKYPIYFVIF